MVETENDPSSDENLKVVIRVRPFVDYEKGTTRVLEVYESFSGTVRNQVIQIKNVKGAKFTFDHVLQSNSTQTQVYDTCVVSLADKCMKGYNATIIAYGQTGSGKTWTIIGPGLTRSTYPDKEDGSPTNVEISDELDGVVPRALKDLFNRLYRLQENDKNFQFSVKLQFLELYGEQIRDLLVPSSAKVTIRDLGGDSEPKVIGATQQVVKSAEEALSLLEKGALRRSTASTNMNADSSRSHALMTVFIRQESSDGTLKSKFQFVDLAGSERLKRTGAEGQRMKEGIDINKGLLTLANVISALGDPKKKSKGFVPYRDSKLTHLLKGSIGGNHKTLMIACVSPAASNAEETENSLRYANRAKNIQNRAVVNMDANTTDSKALKTQVQALAVELLRVRSIAGSSASGGPFGNSVLVALAGGKDQNEINDVLAKSGNVSDDAMKKLQDEISTLKLQIVESNIELEHIRTSEKQHRNKMHDLAAELDNSKKEREASKTEFLSLRRSLDEIQTTSQLQLDEAANEIKETSSKLSKSISELDKLKKRREEDKGTLQKYQEDLSKAVGERDKFRVQLEALSSNDVEKNSLLEETVAKMQVLQLSYETSKRNAAQSTDEIAALTQTVDNLSNEIEELNGALKKEKESSKISSLARTNFERKITSQAEELETLRKKLEEEKHKASHLVDPSTLSNIDEDAFEEMKEELNTVKDKYEAMKAFYDEKVASLQATIDQKEEERGDLIVELNQVRNGGKKKVEETSNGLPLKMEDILRVRLMSMRVLPLLLEDESQRAIAQRNGLTDAILQEMAIFSDSIELNAAAFHALVLLARPLGGKEGSLFQGSMTNSDILVADGDESQKNGIEIMLDSMRRFDSNENLQAKGCWAIVNIALVSTQRTMLLKRGGLGVITNAMRRHPHDTEVQLRAVSALVNMVKPFDVKDSEQSEERDILDGMVDSIADLVIQAMKNCSAQEVILSRACLVLGNLSFRTNYKTALIETPECTDMLRWCLDSFEDNKLIQRCTRDTLTRLGQSVPPKASKSPNKEEYPSRGRHSSTDSLASNNTISSKLTHIEPSRQSSNNSGPPQNPALESVKGINSFADDSSVSSNMSNQSSVIANSARRKSKGFGFFRNKSKSMN